MTANRQAQPSSPPQEVSFREALGVWTRIALLSFGGPAGQISVMHRILVDEKRWLGEQRFLHALNYCMLLPGPEAQQLAVYIGWLMHGVRGGLIAGGLFVLPGLVAIMGLSLVYALFGQVSAVEAVFFGLKAAVLVIVLQALHRLAGRALTSRSLRLIAVCAFIGIFFLKLPFPLIIGAAALAGLLLSRRDRTRTGGIVGEAELAAQDAGTVLGERRARDAASPGAALRAGLILGGAWLLTVAALGVFLGWDNVFARIGVFFSKMAMVTFGGAYAVLAYVAQEAVSTYGWLRPGEMLDGLAMAETTPGPLIMVTQFVGFMGALRDPGGLHPLLAGVLGGLLTTWVTFAPCFVWIFLGAPYVERLRSARALSAALAAITAAVVGVILNLALWLGLHTLFARLTPTMLGPLRLDVPDPASFSLPTAILMGICALAAFGLRVGMGWLLAGSALAGLAWRGLAAIVPALA